MYVRTTRLIRNIILLALLDPKEKGIRVLLNAENYLPNDTALQPTICTFSYMYVKTTINKETSQDKSAETYPSHCINGARPKTSKSVVKTVKHMPLLDLFINRETSLKSVSAQTLGDFLCICMVLFQT
jgi:hypothetical protein